MTLVPDELPRAIGCIAAVALLAASVAALVETQLALGVVVGGVVIAANLYVFGSVIHALFPNEEGKRRGSRLWILVYPLKVLGLFGGGYMLLRSQWVDPIGFVIGAMTLPFGLVVFALTTKHEELPTEENGAQESDKQKSSSMSSVELQRSVEESTTQE
jgi:MFS family permease